MVESIFKVVLQMSMSASIAAGIILMLRWLAGNKLPKIFSYAVWAIVLLRLLVPVSFTSSLSFFNLIPSPEAVIIDRITPNTIMHETAAEQPIRGADTDGAENHEEIDSQNTSVMAAPERNYITVMAYIWLAAALIMLALGAYVYARASQRLKTAVLLRDNSLADQYSRKLHLDRKVKVFTSEAVDTPVVAGAFGVRIILPSSFVDTCSQEDLSLIIAHELVHIKRLDYLIKPVSVLALCIHWFNPLVWFSFILAQKDMEMACDERVLSVNSGDMRNVYANSLINAAAKQNVLLNGGLLAFGESNIKSRIRGIMRFKKTRVWMGITAAVLLVVFGFALLTNGQNAGIGGTADEEKNSPMAFIDDSQLNDLLMHRSKYIGDASNAGNLLSKLPYSDRREGMSLQTVSPPYGITVNYAFDNVEDLQDQIKNIKPVLIDNALILFSLIENVDTVNFHLLSANSYEFQFTRAEMQEYFEKDLWSYSEDISTYEKFLMDISFEILAYPEKYTPAMSSVPGIRLDVSLNAAYYDADFDIEYSVQKGILRTWNSGILSEPRKVISLPYGPVYWSPEDAMAAAGEDIVTISILDKKGNLVIQKQVGIANNDGFYSVKPSYDVITDNLYEP